MTACWMNTMWVLIGITGVIVIVALFKAISLNKKKP